MARHGRVARTPASPRDPAVLPAPRRPVDAPKAVVGGREQSNRDELVRLAGALLDSPTDLQRWRRRRGLEQVLDWLDTFPSEDWQDRWLLSGADQAGQRWGPTGLTPALRQRLTLGLGTLIVLRAVRPSYAWLGRQSPAGRLRGIPPAQPGRRLRRLAAAGIHQDQQRVRR